MKLNAKQIQLLLLKKHWKNLKDYDFFSWANSFVNKNDEKSSDFEVKNPNQEIAVVTLYNDDISSFASFSEIDFAKYCQLHNYTLYTYRSELEKKSFASWSKAKAILNHINDHKYIVWLDSDIIIFNHNFSLESIINSTHKSILATKDIGGHCLINSGVLFFKNDFFSKKILNYWKNYDCDKSALYSSGGDQEILCDILKSTDNYEAFLEIFEMSLFNTDPRLILPDTFILHFMSYPKHLKDFFIRYWNS
jgi:hypothetical protein